MANTAHGTGRKSGSFAGDGTSTDDNVTGVDGSTGDLTDAVTGVAGGDTPSVGGVFDPASLGNAGGTGSTNSEGQPVKRGRGRPKGSGAGKSSGSKSGGKTGSTKNTADFIASTLFSIHMMGSAMLSIPELSISDAEAKQLADAIAEVGEHYDVPLLDPKSAAWGKLVLALGTVYGTRVASMVMTKKTMKKKVVVMPPNGMPVAV